jgi:hypothetical protein
MVYIIEFCDTDTVLGICPSYNMVAHYNFSIHISISRSWNSFDLLNIHAAELLNGITKMVAEIVNVWDLYFWGVNWNLGWDFSAPSGK